MSNKSGTSVISKPSGGGALSGLGEKFSPDLFTGTGNFSVPISTPPGRSGLQPQISLQYSTGNGNSPFGLGWGLSIPNVSRKTSKGVPVYNDEKDVFILSGAEDLIPVEFGTNFIRYRPRTEGLFARIYHYKDKQNNYWKVMTKDGLVSYYGTPESAGKDPATVFDPAYPSNVFSWHLTRSVDLFGSHIQYVWEQDTQSQGNRHWNQIYLSEIKYIDHGNPHAPDYLVSVRFNYENRTDPFSSFRQGFEIRTTRRCNSIEVFTHDVPNTLIRRFDLVYLNERVEAGELPQTTLPLNGTSLVSQLKVTGFKDGVSESMPPLDLGYTVFNPDGHDLTRITGKDLPPGSLARPEYELADLFGNGLPDYLEMAGGVIRYWRNLGNGVFDIPKTMKDAPAGLHLGNPDVQFMDVNGDARVDLVVNATDLSGYFPTSFGGSWDRKSFRKYRQAPSFSLRDPEVKLVDLTGDGVTDAIRSGSRMECFFQDEEIGWSGTRQIPRKQFDDFPNINFSDSRVRWADMCGDGMQDVVLVHDRNVEYWANMGYGNFSKRITMKNAPRLPKRYDPKRLLLGDVDGDGLADILYVENNKVTLWLNQSGNAWSDPVEISGTPPITDADAVRLEDMLGRGVAGVLWSMDKGGTLRHHLYFLDLTNGVKPYLLNETNNNMGALTRVEYRSSIEYYLKHEKRPESRWRTTLPFPVLNVARVEVVDEISQGKLATEYEYHHGYWDGAEREFRGFGRVDQRDTETFERFNQQGLHGGQVFNAAETIHYSPPMESRTWFHLGAVGDEHGDWTAAEYTHEYWQGDINVFPPLIELENLLKTLPRRAKRDAFRSLRGNVLRTELYALDDTDRQNRPYSVAEGQFSVRLEYAPPGESAQGRDHIFFPFSVAQRNTQWERGDDPMTQLSFTADFDAYGQPSSQVAIGVPRQRNYTRKNFNAAEPYLATFSATTYCTPKDEAQRYIVGRTARANAYEIPNNGQDNVFALVQKILNGDAQYRLIGQSLTFYDGPAFEGLPWLEVGDYGIPVRSETLILTQNILTAAYGTKLPPYLDPAGPVWGADYPSGFQTATPALAGYRYHTDQENGYSTGYYAVGARTRFDFQSGVAQPRGLVLASRDPFDNESTIEYDAYGLLPVKATDPQGMTVQAEYDYTTMQVKGMTDPNGNRSAFAFSPLGLLYKAAVMGNPGENKGDTLDDPGIEYRYDFFAFLQRKDPVWVKTITREHHILDGINNNTLHVIEYSDGFGRLVQSRAQTDHVLFGKMPFGDSGLPADQNAPNTPASGVESLPGDPENVVVSGWQVYNNKGWVVEKYEPYFDKGWDFAMPGSAAFGEKVIMFYDPRGNAVRTVNPDRTEQWVIYGHVPQLTDPKNYEPSPWEMYTYGPNDLTPVTHPNIPSAPGSHYFTPDSNLLDALGRTIQTINHQVQDIGSGMEDVVMRYEYDIRGNLLRVTDPYGRTAFSHVYDLKPKAGEDDPGANVLQTKHLDGGLKTAVFNGAGQPVEMRDANGALVLNAFDNLNRPARSWARDQAGETLTLRLLTLYGDAAGLNNPAQDNLLGQAYKVYDEAGLTSFPVYDFKGNPFQKVRRVIKDSEIRNGAPGQAYRVDWTTNDLSQRETALLDTRLYETDLAYDALGRTTRMTYPRDEDGERKVLVPTYNRAAGLQKIALQTIAGTEDYVTHIAYSAKGQRLLVAYGNGIMTRHHYDPKTGRLLRMKSEGYQQTGWTFTPQSGSTRQDYAYQYDLNGNIIAIQDKTPACGLPATPDTLLRKFSYDPLNRLLSATGRESDIGATAYPWEDSPVHNDPNQVRAYTRQYAFDKLGNMQTLQHITPGGNGNFTRIFNYDPGKNTLKHIEVGGNTYTFSHDANGNQTQEGLSRYFEWDHSDRLRAFYVSAGGNASIHAQYLYDGSGTRVKKWVKTQGGDLSVTVYIDGIMDHQYEISGGAKKENNTLHLLDNRIRIATLRVGPPLSANEPADALKYNLEDHLGNASATLNAGGGWISREEYFPYGQSSFGSFVKKRYRFGNKEKDEESGLYYFEARYYAPWIGRFISTDPMAYESIEWSPYKAFRCNPISYVDPSGMNDDEWIYNTVTNEMTWFSSLGGNETQWVHFVKPNEDGGMKQIDTLEVNGPVVFAGPSRWGWAAWENDLWSGIPAGYNANSWDYVRKEPYTYSTRDLKKRYEIFSNPDLKDYQKIICTWESSGNAQPIHIIDAYNQYVAKWGTDSAFWLGAEFYMPQLLGFSSVKFNNSNGVKSQLRGFNLSPRLLGIREQLLKNLHFVRIEEYFALGNHQKWSNSVYEYVIKNGKMTWYSANKTWTFSAKGFHFDRFVEFQLGIRPDGGITHNLMKPLK